MGGKRNNSHLLVWFGYGSAHPPQRSPATDQCGTSPAAAVTKDFPEFFLPATGRLTTFAALDDGDGASAEGEPDAGDSGGVSLRAAFLRGIGTLLELAAAPRPVSESRFRRSNSERMSAACW